MTNLKNEIIIFFDLLIKKTNAISCSLLDQDDNIIFSRNKELKSYISNIEHKKLFELIIKNFKKLLDYQSKIQIVNCSDVDHKEENRFFFLINSFNFNKTIIASFPSTTSHECAYNNFKKTIKTLSYFFNELESTVLS